MHRSHPITTFVLALALAAALPVLPAAAAEGKVNINTATAEQLALLPRIGPSIAARILEFREKNGRFDAPEELILVRGIGEKTFEQLEPFVAVEGDTTLTEKVSASSVEDENG